MESGRKIRSVASNIYLLLWNIENSNQLSQQLKHTRTKFYIYVIPEYRVINTYLKLTPNDFPKWLSKMPCANMYLKVVLLEIKV
jgi:hypothetical protein